MAERPTHELVMIADSKKEGGKSRFTRVAALWPSKADTGLNGEIPEGITVTGRFIVMPLKSDQGRFERAHRSLRFRRPMIGPYHLRHMAD